jgi:ribosomal protein S18 acetylase RimI-like enzyme
MSVTARYRQHDVGRGLLESLLVDLSSDPAIAYINLHVRPWRAAACRLYPSHNIAPAGEKNGKIIIERPLH